jgi:hypothetical protein
MGSADDSRNQPFVRCNKQKTDDDSMQKALFANLEGRGGENINLFLDYCPNLGWSYPLRGVLELGA